MGVFEADTQGFMTDLLGNKVKGVIQLRVLGELGTQSFLIDHVANLGWEVAEPEGLYLGETSRASLDHLDDQVSRCQGLRLL